jgi:hypothetical protein
MKTTNSEALKNNITTEYDDQDFDKLFTVLEQENSILKQKNEELEAKVKYYEEQFKLN